MSKKSGISLIVLVITIIIILILMAATFISYLDVTPVENANEVAFKSDLEGFKVELSTYIQNQRIENFGEYNSDNLNASNENKEGFIDIGEVIPSIKGTEYEDKFDVVEGELVYKGNEPKEEEWAEATGIKKYENVKVVISDVVTGINDLTGKVTVNGEITASDIKEYIVNIGTISGTYETEEKVNGGSLNIDFSADDLKEGTRYYIKVEVVKQDGTIIESNEIVCVTKTDNQSSVEIAEEPGIPRITSVNNVKSDTWIKDNALLQIIYYSDSPSEDEVSLSYKENDGELKEYNGQILISNEGIIKVVPNVYYNGKNTQGNEYIVKIDKTAPEIINVSTRELANTISVSVEAQDKLSGIKGYMYSSDGGKTWSEITTNTSYEFTGLDFGTEYEIQVKVVDNVGNEVTESKSLSTSKINAPVINFTPSASTNQNVLVEIKYDDIPSITKQYRVLYKNGTDSGWLEYVGMFEVDKNATVYARILLNSSVATSTSKEITYIDKLLPTNTAPTVSATTNKLTVTLKQDDASATTDYAKSGLDTTKTQYAIKKNGTWSNWQTSNIFSNLTQNTSYEVKTRVIDKVGNGYVESTSTAINTLKVPDGNTNITITPSSTAWTNKNITATIKYTLITDTKGQYRILNEDGTQRVGWTDYSTTLTIDSNCTIEARIIDNTNQIGTTKSYKVTNIDKVAPNQASATVSSGTLGSNSWYKSNITIRVTAGTDNLSGVNRVTYSLSGATTKGETTITSGGTFTITANGTTTITVYTYDNAGNKSAAKTLSVKKDSSVPTQAGVSITSGTPGENGWYKSNIGIRVTQGTDSGGSGVNRVVYALSGAMSKGETTISNGGTFSVTAEGTTTITVYTYDNAGNKSAAKTLTVKKDTVAPTYSGVSWTNNDSRSYWTNTDRRVISFTATDNASGILQSGGKMYIEWRYTKGTDVNNALASYAAYDLSISGNRASDYFGGEGQMLFIRFRDVAGNWTGWMDNGYYWRIDKTAPFAPYLTSHSGLGTVDRLFGGSVTDQRIAENKDVYYVHGSYNWSYTVSMIDDLSGVNSSAYEYKFRCYKGGMLNQDGWYETPPSGNNYPPYETWMTADKLRTYNLEGHSVPWWKMIDVSKHCGVWVRGYDNAGNMSPHLVLYLQHLS